MIVSLLKEILILHVMKLLAICDGVFIYPALIRLKLNQNLSSSFLFRLHFQRHR